MPSVTMPPPGTVSDALAKEEPLGGNNPIALRWRLADRVKLVGGCWLWQGAVNNLGYPQIRLSRPRRHTALAHRVSYEVFVGPTTGLCVLHRCDTPRCINPAHLFLGTMKDNTHDMYAKGRNRNGSEGKTHCKRGHPYSGENLLITAGGNRACRKCNYAARRAWRARQP